MTKEQQGFIDFVGMRAQQEMSRSGILASLNVAQAILESGWGKSKLSTVGFALYGIKATAAWKGKVYSSQTQECFDGVNSSIITAAFRAYDSWDESIRDHTNFLLENPRYKALIGEKDYIFACMAIKAAGYATDPEYAKKLINLIELYELTKYDAPAAPPMGLPEMTKTELLSRLHGIKKCIDEATEYVNALPDDVPP